MVQSHTASKYLFICQSGVLCFFGSSHSCLSGISRSSNIYASMHAIDDSTTEELEKQTKEEVAVAFLNVHFMQGGLILVFGYVQI